MHNVCRFAQENVIYSIFDNVHSKESSGRSGRWTVLKTYTISLKLSIKRKQTSYHLAMRRIFLLILSEQRNSGSDFLEITSKKIITPLFPMDIGRCLCGEAGGVNGMDQSIIEKEREAGYVLSCLFQIPPT